MKRQQQCIQLVLALLGVFLAVGSAVAGEPDTLRVRPDGKGEFETIQDAIDGAGPGDVVELADGTYQGPRNRNLTVSKALEIRSGSGDPANCVINCQDADSGERFRAIRFNAPQGSITTMYGIQIVNGSDGNDLPFAVVDCGRGHIVLESCIFLRLEGNPVEVADATAELRHCLFQDNQGRFAGALRASLTSVSIVDCRFEGNVGEAVGVIDAPEVDLSVSNSWFVDNEGGSVGVVACDGEQGRLDVNDSVFESNVGGGTAALLVDGLAGVSMTGAMFRGNESSSGGVIVVRQSESTFRGLVIAGNTGSSIISYSGSGVKNHRLEQSTIADNEASGDCLICIEDNQLVVGVGLIVASNRGQQTIDCNITGGLSVGCTNVAGNAGGDFVGCLEGQGGINGNISLDPMFCNPKDADFGIHVDSPCAPFSPPNKQCDLIGALPVSCPPTPTIQDSWGGLKGLFRSRGTTGSRKDPGGPNEH